MNVPAGAYKLSANILTHSYAGIYSLKFNGADNWPSFDMYTPGSELQTLDFGTITVADSGPQTLLFEAISKNANAFNYRILLDTITLTPKVIHLIEAEATNYIASGAGTSIKTDTASSNESYLRFNGNSIGDSITLPIPDIETGSYNLSVNIRTHAYAGIYRLILNGEDHWSTFDLYAPGSTIETLDFGAVNISQSGSQSLIFEAVSKNTHANNYRILIDTVTFEAN
jgi:hypothetical protein